MIDLQFTGDMGPIQGILFALIVSTAAWLLYFRQIRHRQGMARIALPSLRAASIFLLIMMLTQPVLHHEKLIGELGKLFVVVDNSGSMGVTDPDASLYRKVMIAKSLGHNLDEVDTSKITPLIKLQESRTSLQNKLASKDADVSEMQNEFIEAFEVVSNNLKKDKDKFIKLSEQVKKAKEPKQVQGAVQGLLNSSSELIAIYEKRLNESLAKYAKLPAIKSFERSSRWHRIEKNLLEGNNPLLDRLAEDHEIELIHLKGEKLETVWNSTTASKKDDQKFLNIQGTLPKAELTDLDKALQLETGPQKTAILLLSDGQHNFGAAPVQQSKILGNKNVKIYTIGFGAEHEPQDLSIQEMITPDAVFYKNNISGTLQFNDHMQEGKSFTVKVSHGKEVLWEKDLETDGSGLRHIDFSFPIKDKVEDLLKSNGGDLQFKNLPLQLKASLSMIEGDRQRANNIKNFNVTAAIQKRRLLLVDQRARWEWRYLKSMFERNEKWDVNAVRPEQKMSGLTFKRGREKGNFPIDKKELFNYDLIVFGDIQSSLFNHEEMTWLREYVELRGGGLVFIDGRRNGLQSYGETPMKSLIPVKWNNNNGLRQIDNLKLTVSGNKHKALKLGDDKTPNQQVWSELAKINWMADTQSLSGTDMLITANDKKPILVSRHFGAGKILYTASEDFWRWRYKKGDIHHNRFWQQIADSMMEKAFSVQDKHIALDTGKPVYQEGEQADLRVRIRDEDGRLMNNADARALVYKDEKVIAKLPLKGSGPGLYSVRSEKLEQGSYEVKVRVNSLSSSKLKATAAFSVEKPQSQERAQLTVNDKLLKDISHNSGGKYFPEEQIHDVRDELKSLSSGKLIQIDTALWQSYWYFALVIAFFTMEWIYRKRIGLL
ncbi:MAG: hypothetical protein MK132_23200 [Lentisphaerales bacterium]|nr:hypothetical protein [Lentisphaerales bacterium]